MNLIQNDKEKEEANTINKDEEKKKMIVNEKYKYSNIINNIILDKWR